MRWVKREEMSALMKLNEMTEKGSVAHSEYRQQETL